MNNNLKHGKKLSDYKLVINLEDLPLNLKLLLDDICDDFVTQLPKNKDNMIDVKNLLNFITTYDKLNIDQIMNIFGSIDISKFLKDDNG